MLVPAGGTGGSSDGRQGCNRTEGGEAASSSYREQLADKIAQAIVEYRYGSGVYNAPPAAADNTAPAPPIQVR